MKGKNNNLLNRIVYSSQTVLVFTVLFFIFLFVANFSLHGEEQFVYLAQSFLQGKTYFLEMPGSWADAVFFSGKYYWPLGPLPAILLMPFVFVFNIFNLPFYQGYLQIFLAILIFFLSFKIARKYKLLPINSYVLSFAFCFSSIFIGVSMLSWSWYFAQVITTLFLFLILYEWLGKKRYLLLGLLCGCLIMTRIWAGSIAIFLLLDILFKFEGNKKAKIAKTIQLCFPILISVVVILIYNYVRFGSYLETGYTLQLLRGELDKARGYGLFSITHVPGNIYYLFLSFPLPVFRDSISHVLTFPFIKMNPWGMSIFLTSPYLIYLLKDFVKDKVSAFMLISVFTALVMMFFYYGIGYRQFGYRYALDFLPLLHFLLIRNISLSKIKLSNVFILLIYISALVNLYLFTTFH